jgi:hypothetical protein
LFINKKGGALMSENNNSKPGDDNETLLDKDKEKIVVSPKKERPKFGEFKVAIKATHDVNDAMGV